MLTSDQLTLSQLATQQSENEGHLQQLCQKALSRAAELGAQQAEIWCSNSVGNSLEVRQGELETIEFNQDSHFGINVFYNQCKGTVSINDVSEAGILKGVQAAFNIANYTEADTFAGLADKSLMATSFKDLSLDHPNDLPIEHFIEQAIICEQAGLKVKNIKQSEGANFYNHRSVSIYANSHEFMGVNRSTRNSLSNSFIAENSSGMHRDGWYSHSRCLEDLQAASSIGKQAAERVVSKLNHGKARAGKFPVIFTPETARTIWGHLLSAIKGGALYQKSSFMLDKKGQLILPNNINIMEDPFILKGFGSCNYDSEGVRTKKRNIVSDGILQDYFLSSYSARKLGLESTASAGGIHNILIDSEQINQAELIKSIGTGLLVTEVMGQGVNIVTGNYSRGASGFWIENGEIQHFVQEITIAGSLTEMLRNIIAVANDIDSRSSILTGSIAIEGMTVATN